MSGLMVTAWVVGCTLAYLACGFVGGLHFAGKEYRSTAKRFDDRFAREMAKGALVFSIIGGPLTLIAAAGNWLVDHAMPRAIPEIAEADRKERIKALEAELDAAHRQLGIAPLRRDAS